MSNATKKYKWTSEVKPMGKSTSRRGLNIWCVTFIDICELRQTLQYLNQFWKWRGQKGKIKIRKYENVILILAWWFSPWILLLEFGWASMKGRVSTSILLALGSWSWREERCGELGIVPLLSSLDNKKPDKLNKF